MFKDFNRQGHKTLSAEITRELQALAQRHGLDISAGGGQIGTTELTIKVIAKSGDTQAVAAEERRTLGLTGRWLGLTEADYDTEIREGGRLFRLKGVSSNRPRYPIDMLNVATGKMHKATQNYAAKFVKARLDAQSAVPVMQTKQPQVAPTAQAIDGLEALAAF